MSYRSHFFANDYPKDSYNKNTFDEEKKKIKIY